jgi:lipoprotein signal peptidase
MTAVLLLAALVVLLDQVTKAIALERLAPGVPIVVFDQWLSLTLVMNPGLAFGLLGSVPPAWR